MCGLVGVVDGAGATDERTLSRMLQTVRHRGPDAEGVWRSGPVSFLHARLSVIDLVHSRQPMATDDGRLHLVYNGELYNYRALREELRGQGVRFRTEGDTEVLLSAWKRWGAACLPRLRGMFAFAVWDSEAEELVLVRDHAGIKPLYWQATADGGLLFASEPKAVLAHPAGPGAIDVTAIAHYLETQYIPGPRSAWEGLRRLPAGCLLRWRRDTGARIERWDEPPAQPPCALRGAELLDAVEESLRASVRSMLVADVPVGAFLSGGVDSSTLVALMAEVGSVKTFTLAFGDRHQVSEHEEAAAVAAHLGVDHHELEIDSRDVLAELERSLDLADEPFGDNAALPTMLLARLTRQHVTVALSGESADEVFGGYRSYVRARRDAALRRWLGWPGSPVPWLVRRLPTYLRDGHALQALAHPIDRVATTMPFVIPGHQQKVFFTPALRRARAESMRDLAQAWYRRCPVAEHVERVMHVDRGLWLVDDLLQKVDRATMAYGLEARVPYLDPDLLHLVRSIPTSVKLADGRVTKAVLKGVAERHLPHPLVHRKKQGFSMPLGAWLREDLRDLCEDALGPAGLERRGLLRSGALRRLWTEHRDGRRDRGHRLWALLMLELWLRRHRPDFCLD